MRRTQYPELPDSIMLPAVTHDTDDGADGFSLLELVVAVSIMLILGVVGFVAYQSYTDNARQANVDSQANQVLTAAVAADNAPNDSVNNAVREYNKSSSEISANITEATSDSLTVSAIDRAGTLGLASVSGNYSHVETTNFSPPGITFEWTGEPGASTSIMKQDGKVVSETVLPGFYGGNSTGGETIHSANHVSIGSFDGISLSYDMPADAETVRYRFESRSTDGDENGQYTNHTTYGGAHRRGHATKNPADGQWRETVVPAAIVDSGATRGHIRFRTETIYTDTAYEVRNVQVAFNDDPFPDFYDGDSA